MYGHNSTRVIHYFWPGFLRPGISTAFLSNSDQHGNTRAWDSHHISQCLWPGSSSVWTSIQWIPTLYFTFPHLPGSTMAPLSIQTALEKLKNTSRTIERHGNYETCRQLLQCDKTGSGHSASSRECHGGSITRASPYPRLRASTRRVWDIRREYFDLSSVNLTGDVCQLAAEDVQQILVSGQISGNIWLTDTYGVHTTPFIIIPMTDDILKSFETMIANYPIDVILCTGKC